MKEWKTYKLSEIGQVIGGATPSTKVASNYDGDIAWITPKDLSLLSGRYIYKGERSITEAGYKSCSCQMLPAGSILFSSRAPIGYIAIAGNDLCTNQGFKSVVPNPEIVNSHFLYYLLSYEKNRIAEMGSGTTFMEISGNVMKNIEVKLPHLSIQNKIAEILTSLDEKIENNQRINDNLEQQASNLFQDWLNNCENSIMLRELTDNVLDYTPNTHEYVYLLNSSDVTEGQFTVLPLTPNINLKGQFKKRFKKGDILYSEIRPRNRHYAYCYFDADKYIASTRLIVLRAKPEMLTSSILLYQYLMLNNVFEEFTLKTESRSGTFPQGNYEDLSSIKVPYGASQEKIVKALESIYKQLWINLEENERLEALRDSLLPKLMSGELKINEIDC